MVAAGCGGKSGLGDGSARAADSGGTAGTRGTAGGSGGGSADGTSAGGTSAGACADAGVPQSSTGLPGAVGCYAGTTSGWVRIACNCELLIQNPAPAGVEVRVHLTVSGSDVAPSLTDARDVEVAFDDPHGSWLETWAHQTENGGTFSATGLGGTTTVRLGAMSVSLDAVPLAGCELRTAEARLSGLPGLAQLGMQAVLTGGNGGTSVNLSGSCINFPHL